MGETTVEISGETLTDNKRKPRRLGRGLSDRHRREIERVRLAGVVCRHKLNGKKLAVGLGSATREIEDTKSKPVPCQLPRPQRARQRE